MIKLPLNSNYILKKIQKYSYGIIKFYLNMANTILSFLLYFITFSANRLVIIHNYFSKNFSMIYTKIISLKNSLNFRVNFYF